MAKATKKIIKDVAAYLDNMINRLTLMDSTERDTQQVHYVHYLKVDRILTIYSISVHKTILNKFQSFEIRNQLHEENWKKHKYMEAKHARKQPVGQRRHQTENKKNYLKI